MLFVYLVTWLIQAFIINDRVRPSLSKQEHKSSNHNFSSDETQELKKG